MNDYQILESLLAAAEELGFEVRKEQIDGISGGGLCKLKNRYVLIIDRTSPLSEQINAAASSLKDRPELESIYLRPQVRDAIESTV